MAKKKKKKTKKSPKKKAAKKKTRPKKTSKKTAKKASRKAAKKKTKAKKKKTAKKKKSSRKKSSNAGVTTGGVLTTSSGKSSGRALEPEVLDAERPDFDEAEADRETIIIDQETQSTTAGSRDYKSDDYDDSSVDDFYEEGVDSDDDFEELDEPTFGGTNPDDQDEDELTVDDEDPEDEGFQVKSFEEAFGEEDPDSPTLPFDDEEDD